MEGYKGNKTFGKPKRINDRNLMQGQPRDPVSGLATGLKVFGYDLPKDIYQRFTETGRYAPKPKPKTRTPYTASDGTILEGFSKEFIQEYERGKKKQRNKKNNKK